MAGFIRDRGIVSALHRGAFFACRNDQGKLEGVALIGHAMMLETDSEAAFQSFARLAHNCPTLHVIVGEREKMNRFCRHYLKGKENPRIVFHELLEQRWPVGVYELVPGLRLATLADLSLLQPVQAELAFAESGIDPSEIDPEGFEQRMKQRINRDRIYLWVENGRLIFKADVVAQTPEVTYVEGVYVNPQDRRQGYGLRCLTQLSRTLLAQSRSISLLVDAQNLQALDLYRKAGYRLRGHYDTIFLRQQTGRTSSRNGLS